jgi:putative toxin-antitoxin system antitoxin component (TIGR02293 family)
MVTTGAVNLDIADLLGGTKVLGPTKELADLQHAIREGLPYAALEALAVALELSHRDIATALGLPRLGRPTRGRHLSLVASDRLYRLAHVSRLAAEVLGNLDKARTWLGRANRALGGQTPLSMLDTEIGVREVQDVLARINYGMYS